jgi:hypothetical protein
VTLPIATTSNRGQFGESLALTGVCPLEDADPLGSLVALLVQSYYLQPIAWTTNNFGQVVQLATKPIQLLPSAVIVHA